MLFLKMFCIAICCIASHCIILYYLVLLIFFKYMLGLSGTLTETVFVYLRICVFVFLCICICMSDNWEHNWCIFVFLYLYLYICKSYTREHYFWVPRNITYSKRCGRSCICVVLYFCICIYIFAHHILGNIIFEFLVTSPFQNVVDEAVFV